MCESDVFFNVNIKLFIVSSQIKIITPAIMIPIRMMLFWGYYRVLILLQYYYLSQLNLVLFKFGINITIRSDSVSISISLLLYNYNYNI